METLLKISSILQVHVKLKFIFKYTLCSKYTNINVSLLVSVLF